MEESSLDKYDSKSERITDKSTVLDRFVKYASIAQELEKRNIKLVDVCAHTVKLEDKTCGYTLEHAISSWEIFRVVDVVDMIVKGRDNFIERKKQEENGSK